MASARKGPFPLYCTMSFGKTPKWIRDQEKGKTREQIEAECAANRKMLGIGDDFMHRPLVLVNPCSAASHVQWAEGVPKGEAARAQAAPRQQPPEARESDTGNGPP